MPELPEVETIRRGLQGHLVGKRIQSVSGKPGRLFRNNPGGYEQVAATLQGKLTDGLRRRGKFIWMEFDGEDQVLVVHLGMSGQARVTDSSARHKHEYLRLHLDGGTQVSFIDPRTFGHLTLSEVRDSVPVVLEHIAPDPLDARWDADAVISRMRASRRPIKTMLLDQAVLSGVGNIYADEALHRAHMHGRQRGTDLAKDQVAEVLAAAQQVMREAIKVGGTSFDSLYVNTDGEPGYFSRSLSVYGRSGESCVCGTEILQETISGRSHFYCPKCQPPS